MNQLGIRAGVGVGGDSDVATIRSMAANQHLMGGLGSRAKGFIPAEPAFN